MVWGAEVAPHGFHTGKRFFQMLKQNCEILQYGEIDETFERRFNEATGDPSWSLTRGDDQALVQELRDLNEEEPDEDDGEYYWSVRGVSHTPQVTTIEFLSARGHLSVTIILWVLA